MQRQLNLPNRITLIRVILVPVIVGFLISPSRINSVIAAAVFCVASLTDWLDGYLARGKQQITLLGKLLDPIADKILVASALIPLVALQRVPAWMAVVIIGREFAVTGLRLVAIPHGVTINPTALGKTKTVAEIAAIIALILNIRLAGMDLPLLGTILLWLALLISLVSALDYFRKAKQQLQW